ncbi:MAG: VWA domain-containing protein [Planctomycetaceae bacterium]|nr:VWA domain-containing protein [Planctomycetaceae bacterium]
MQQSDSYHANLRKDSVQVLVALLAFSAGVLITLVVVFFAASTTAAEESPSLFRHASSDGADSPSGRLLLRMPAKDQTVGDDGPGQEEGEPPAEPNGPGEEGGDDATFFGESMGGAFVFIIDVSSSMKVADMGAGEDWNGNANGSMSRLDAVKTELIKFLRTMPEGSRFGIVWLAGDKNNPPVTDVWKSGEMAICDTATQADAINAVADQQVWGCTPTWKALKRACTEYPDEIDTMVFLTDGIPVPYGEGEWGQRTHAGAALSDFPGWFAGKKAYGCKLIAVHVGWPSNHQMNQMITDFVQRFCSMNDAVYVRK